MAVALVVLAVGAPAAAAATGPSLAVNAGATGTHPPRSMTLFAVPTTS